MASILHQAGWDGRQPALAVLGASQRILMLGRNTRRHKRRGWPVSTGKAGFGNAAGSGRTPTGLHRICEAIGGDAPPGMIFKSRLPTGRILLTSDTPGEDFITTRILWLEGLEEGVNRGAGIDTRERYIYIHGTPHVSLLGTPVSAGCIRMKPAHVRKLFRRVGPGTLVYILPDTPGS